MATEATFTIPSDQFPLGNIFAQFPNAKIELERVIPATDRVVPYFWVRGSHTENMIAVFEQDPHVIDVDLIDSVEDEYLFRTELEKGYDGVLDTLIEWDISLIKAVGTHEKWTFDIRGDKRDHIASFHQSCREHDIQLTLTKLHALTPIESDTEHALTEKQKEVLTLAFNRGYFKLPREVTMEDLGEELGITQQAVASRTRRGISHIMEDTLSETVSS